MVTIPMGGLSSPPPVFCTEKPEHQHPISTPHDDLDCNTSNA